jgi:sugar phosphate isomerase/epimerase
LIKLSEELSDPVGLAIALETSGSVAMARGDLVAARGAYAAAEPLFLRIGDAHGVAVVASNLAYIALLEDDESALELCERAVDATRAETRLAPDAISLLTLAFAHVRRGNADAAFSSIREATEIASKLGHKVALSYCVEASGAAAVRSDSETAARLLAAADAARSALGVALDPFEARIDQEARAQASASLSPERFAAAWAEGASLTLDQAIEIALGRPLAVPPA